jgi:glycosyltransferase involved in cell wall biosynthesis
LASGLVQPKFYQTRRSRPIAENIFDDFQGERIYRIARSASYFVAGEDWFLLDAAGVDTAGAPVINLVQGFRHADPRNALFACLSRPALRICVSDAVAESIRPHANGEVEVIPNGIEINELPRGAFRQASRVLIAGWKKPALALDVAKRLRERVDVELITEPTPRPAFLRSLAQAAVSVLLPLDREGFFLPPLEAMSLGSTVVTVDCLGNRYCVDGGNCILTEADPDALSKAALALVLDPERRRPLIAAGLETAAHHSLKGERQAYHRVLRDFLSRSQ